MAVEPSEVKIGRCFVTARNQVRRVIDITNDKVQYEARGSRSSDPWGPGSNLSNPRSKISVTR